MENTTTHSMSDFLQLLHSSVSDSIQPDYYASHDNDSDKCGLCRRGIGLGVDYFHCDRCMCCLAISFQSEGHRCTENALAGACPMCLEPLSSTTKRLSVLKDCGHYLHTTCLNRLARRQPTCPVCSRSFVDRSAEWNMLDALVAEQPMPDEFAATRAVVSCCDCNVRSEIAWHFLALRCAECGSYNTNLVERINMPDESVLRRLDAANNRGDDELNE